MAGLAHRHLAAGADTVWFCFYYCRRSVVKAIYYRRWEIPRKVLRVKSRFCVRSAPNLVMLSGLFTHGALSRVHTSIFSLLWLKTNQTKTFYIHFKWIQPPWVPEYGLGNCHFKWQSTLSLPVTWQFIWYQDIVVHSKYLWILNHTGFSTEQEILKIERLEVL